MNYSKRSLFEALNIVKSKKKFGLIFKGAGGVDDLEKVKIKKYCSQPKLSDFEILKMWVITVHARNLNLISQKWTFLEFKSLVVMFLGLKLK